MKIQILKIFNNITFSLNCFFACLTIAYVAFLFFKYFLDKAYKTYANAKLTQETQQKQDHNTKKISLKEKELQFQKDLAEIEKNTSLTKLNLEKTKVLDNCRTSLEFAEKSIKNKQEKEEFKNSVNEIKLIISQL